HDRPVHFEDVDAAGIVFFARFFAYCHDAMERFFDGVDGGYVALITERKIGFPAVHASSDFKAPITYGDVARIAGTVT
ncbi:acyl-CoA thioesterase, partial [Escherichia coli]|uniref:acyl-CoA thioesterase n=1 Tax=Escherichia coli TaxID=562 RepID=UPI00159BEC8F